MAHIQAGQTIGPYRIIQPIGRGGMASVYKAYQPAMERYVALKILPDQLAESPEFAGRFQQEARIIARLEHAHILPVHDYGESEGHTYLAMRFIEGGTLSDRLRAGPLAPADIDRWFFQLADALDYAHAQGVVHRDLKPSNVLLDARGDVFLTDFGIAKLLEADKRFTGTDTLIGTPAYMSPEQGQGLRVDQRTDIYSLGIMLYEMVTGQLPFDADTPLAIILKHINDPLPLPTRLNPNLSPAVEQVLLKALAKNPDDRFATAAEFSAAWRAARLATGVPAAISLPPLPPVSATIRSQRPAARPSWTRGLPLLAAGALLVTAIVVCGGVLAVVVANQQGRLFPPRPTQAGTPAASTPAAGATPAVAATVAPVGAGGPAEHWRSWAAANNVVALALFNGQLVSGGPGGLTRWNLADGSVAGRLTTGNGLPDPNVTALLVDDQTQTLWIATEGGVVAFDGQTTRVYDESSGLDSNTVTALARTRRGLLAGTAYSSADGGGLNLFDGNHWQPVAGFPSSGQTDTHPDQLSTSVTAILEDSQGLWWVGTANGLGRYDGQTWKRFSTADGLPDNEIVSLAVVSGTVWAGTRGGPAQLQANTFVPAIEAQGRSTNGMFQSANGDLWFMSGDAILRRPAAGGNWQTFERAQFPAGEAYSGLEGPGGAIYFASDAGVLRFNGRAFDLWSVPNVPTQSGYRHILAGLAGELWFVQQDGSNIDLLDLAGPTWQPIPSASCNSCAPLAWGPDGRLWAGSEQGMYIVKGAAAFRAIQSSIAFSDVTHLTTDQGLPDGPAWAVAFASDGSTWIGTTAGVAVYAGAPITTVYTAANAGLADDSVNHLLAAGDGSMWVATNTDLSRRTPDGQWIHYGPGNPFQSDVRVNGLAQDSSGAIWVATDGEGVYRFAGDAWTQFRPGVGGVRLPSTEVLCVTPARDGSVWFGTARTGAARFDGKTWQAFAVADGLIDDSVNDIYVDSAGVVWFATSGGVSAYQP